MVGPCRSSPRSWPWAKPCTFSDSLRDDHQLTYMETDTEISTRKMQQYKDDMVMAIAKTQKLAKRATKYIMKKQLKHKKLKAHCKSSIPLRGMPQTKSEKLFKEQWHEALPDDFRRLAVLSAFIHEGIHKEDNPRKIVTRLKRIQEQLIKSMCMVEKTALSFKHHLNYGVTPAIVPEMYKNLTDQSDRDQKNCLLLLNAARILSDIATWYSKL